jgi:hypothetical protein
MMEEIGISATLIIPQGGHVKIVLIKRIFNGQWLVRFPETDHETEVFEHEFVPD